MYLSELIKNLDIQDFVGNKNIEIKSIDSIRATNNDPCVLFWVNSKNKEILKDLKTGTVICENDSLPSPLQPACNYLITKNPRREFQKALSLIYDLSQEFGICASSNISIKSEVHSKTYIGHNVVIEDGCIVGEGTRIDSNTVVKRGTIIGKYCTIGCNCTIGGVGFGFEKNDEGNWELIPHVGNVIIEDKVDIGNNTTIDRAVLGSTIIRKNSKIDNLVHIAHGVDVGENSMVIANAMVAGSVTIGHNSWIAPSSSILNKKKVGNNVVIGLGAVVLKDVADNTIIIGNPGKELIKN
jgi:UDP-3-O-[3-hydroxymyristoyl] glucosamine N-acyltransferase